MTDEENGIVGEWFINNGSHFYQKKYNEGQIIPHFRKATKEELIAHFTKKEEKARVYSSPQIEEILGDKNYAEISLRIEGVLTRFIAEKEYQRMIDIYESRIRELVERNKRQFDMIASYEKTIHNIKVLL